MTFFRLSSFAFNPLQFDPNRENLIGDLFMVSFFLFDFPLLVFFLFSFLYSFGFAIDWVGFAMDWVGFARDLLGMQMGWARGSP